MHVRFLENIFQSLKPEIDGLFCERIFGPVKDFECACGKKPTNFQKFCPNCLVEFTSSKNRRYRLGFIKLVTPTTHVWYLKGRPSYLAILLNLTRKQAESIIYCTESVLISIFPITPNLIFYKNKKTSLQIKKVRDITKIKNKLLTRPFSKPFSLFASFTLHLLNLDFFPIQNHLYLYGGKRNIQSKINILKNISIITQSTCNNQDFIKPTLSRILRLKKFWDLKNANSKCNEDFKNLSNIKQNKKNKYAKIESSFFIIYYYTIQRNFCWEESLNCNYFIHYMTNFPNKKDLVAYYYRISTRQHLNKFNNKINVGAQLINILLKALSQKPKLRSLWALERQVRIYLFEITELSSQVDFLERIKVTRRLKLISYFRRTKNKPNWLILSILPVLPPDLRPIIQLEGNQIAISDLNKLYQKVLFRNRRIQKLKIGHYLNTSEEIQYAQRLLQESVDCLIENGKGGIPPSSTSNNRPLKSLSDILKGKRGRFRQNLLGKRVDYSGRSVIVVGPHLKIHECGIPKEMAFELFQPFLIRSLVFQKKARTILGAKQIIQKRGEMISQLLNKIIQNYPILLNRAPTLHRLSIQAFQPRLVEGRAIILHPLVCSSFNADFDGDQMAVHIPLSYQARAEAWKILWSQNNLLSSATGHPVLTPTQDIVLGWYYLTATDSKIFYINLIKYLKKPLNWSIIKKLFNFSKILNFYKFKIFKNQNDILLAYQQNKLEIHTPIWFFWKGLFETDKKEHSVFEIQLSQSGDLILLSNNFLFRYDWYGEKISQYILSTAGRVILNYFIPY